MASDERGERPFEAAARSGKDDEQGPAVPRGDAPRERVAACALALFSRHGVAGTSLQMIAAELGVTKAAVYYHFRTKEAVVRAVLAPAFASFEQLLDDLDGHPLHVRPAMLVDGLARQAVEHRALYSVVLQDVTAAELRRGSARDRDTFERLRDALVALDDNPDARVRATIFLSGLMGPPVEPSLTSMDDETLRAAIATAGRLLLRVDDASQAAAAR